MSDNLSVISHDYTTDGTSLRAMRANCPHSHCRTRRARAVCGKLLADLALLRDATSEADRLRYTVALGSLPMLTGYLLVMLDEEDAAKR